MGHSLARLGIAALLLVAACGPSTGAPQPAAKSGAPGQPPASSGGAAPAGTPAGGATGATSSGTPQQMVSMKYGYAATSLSFLPMKVAVEQGLYRQYGYDVEPVLVGAGVMAAAQIAGEIEYSTSYPASIRTAAQGAPLKIVSTQVTAPLFVMMGRPEITNIADLRGKSVGITTRGGAIDKVTRDVLEQAGLQPETDVTILPAGAQVTVLLEALLSGRVQAGLLSPPWFVRAREQGLRVLVRTPDVLQEPQNGLAVMEERLTRQREQVRQMVQAEIEAGRFMRQNRAGTVAIIRDWLEISQAEAEESYDFALPAISGDGRIDLEALKRYVAAEKQEGTVAPEFEVERILDLNVVPEALRALEQRGR
jgi:ABC-type nitrate/sulfonate/bicarbonate transport system substrate-binding protein